MVYERKTIDILVSDELKNILKEIESESIVASLLLKKRHSKEDLIEDPVNYISISTQDKTKLSYLTHDRLGSIDQGEYWTSSRRYHAKPGSFVTKVFKNISAKEVEKFSNLFRSEVNKPEFTFDIVNGEKIREFYRWSCYASNERGTLGASCMKHDGCQRSLDIYVENKEASMLVMLNGDGMLMGRALLWDFSSYKIMDRIYTINDEELQFYFKKWATSNGYFYKSEQNWYNTLFFEQFGGKKIELYLDLQINTDFRYLPYMDTFKFIDINSGRLHNYIPENTNIRTLCATDGSKYESDYLRFDSIDKVFRFRGDSIFIDYLNIFTSEQNTRWSHVNDKYILKTDAYYDEVINDYIFTAEMNHLNNQERIDDMRKRVEEGRNKMDWHKGRGMDILTIYPRDIYVQRIEQRHETAVSEMFHTDDTQEPVPSIDLENFSNTLYGAIIPNRYQRQGQRQNGVNETNISQEENIQ
jgi:hypothetical protein